VDAKAALADIKGFGAANRIRIGRHAWERMAERGVLYEDVRNALATARRCKAQDGGRWKVSGSDRDGDELVLIVALEAGVIVVTVF
jgi:hypothetical protein